jgi:hypothetical protein
MHRTGSAACCHPFAMVPEADDRLHRDGRPPFAATPRLSAGAPFCAHQPGRCLTRPPVCTLGPGATPRLPGAPPAARSAAVRA